MESLMTLRVSSVGDFFVRALGMTLFFLPTVISCLIFIIGLIVYLRTSKIDIMKKKRRMAFTITMGVVAAVISICNISIAALINAFFASM